MIAYTGELMYKNDKKVAIDVGKVDISSKERTDQVNVTWR
jgi:tRNA A37 threonylcarbamoyltransferase TsaD